MRCSAADVTDPAERPTEVLVPHTGPEPDEELSRSGLGALERVVAACPGVPRSVPPAVRRAAPEF